MEPFVLAVTVLSLGLVAVLAPRFGADSRGGGPAWPAAPFVSGKR
jgi:hypothetical protein